MRFDAASGFFSFRPSHTRAEATDFSQIAAGLHDAPLTAAVATRIFKEPAAILAAAFSQPQQVARRQQQFICPGIALD